MNSSLKIYGPAAQQVINTDFEIQLISDNNIFTEGPVWNKEGYYLYSDIPANVIYKINHDLKREVFITNSGTDNPADPLIKTDQAGSNALAYNKENELLVCQHGNHGVAKYTGNKLVPFIYTYKGRPFNSPNDFIIHDDNRIYFSDPPYGLKNGQPNPEIFQPVAGVYCWKEGVLDMICDKYQYPNGVCLSPDQSVLYICSNKPFEKFISAYETATNKFIKIFAEENSDGIECDREGNVYLCNKDGIIILDKEGQRLALIQLHTIPANICWGGNNLNDLFITARENIFLIKNLRN
jgi:gluconolactonase